MSDAKLKTVRFTAALGGDGIRFESDGTGRSGMYVPEDVTAALLSACKRIVAAWDAYLDDDNSVTFDDHLSAEDCEAVREAIAQAEALP